MRLAHYASVRLRFSYFHGEAAKFRIVGNNEGQAIYLPKASLKLSVANEFEPLPWFWNKRMNRHKLHLANQTLDK